MFSLFLSFFLCLPPLSIQSVTLFPLSLICLFSNFSHSLGGGFIIYLFWDNLTQWVLLMEVVVGFVGNVDGGAGVWYGLFLGLLVEYGGLPGELWSSMVVVC